MPLALTDEQMTAIMRGAEPIAPARRGAYLREIADALAGQELGDGIIGRTIREIQKRHYDVPTLDHDHSKYR